MDLKQQSTDWTAQSINDSGKHLNNLTVGFVGLLTYSLVTAASIDHGDLLIGRKVVLPLLDVEVPIHHFFGFVALFIVTLHAHIILHMMQLRDKLGSAYTSIHDENGIHSEHHPEKLFYPYPVVWLMMPSWADRSKVRYKVVKALYYTIYVLAPLATIFILQITLLPSHRESILTIITALLFVDVASISLGLPIDFTDTNEIHGKHRKRDLLTFARRRFMVLMLLPVILNLVIVHSSPTDCRDYLTFGGHVQRNLKVLPGDLADDDGPLKLEGRDLRCGHFAGINLSKADLQGADLRGAVFTSTLLKGASFLPAGISRRQWEDWDEEQRRLEIERVHAETCLTRPNEVCPDPWRELITRLDGADFTNADLTDASLALAVLIGAKLNGADLIRADLSGVIARGAELNRAKVTKHANLFMAQLDGAKLNYADFSEAILREASAVGASFLSADLTSSQITASQLVAATLVDVEAPLANFSGTSLVGADLRGANLSGAKDLNLQTTIATHANFSEATLEPTAKAPLWVDLREATTTLDLFEPLIDKERAFDPIQNQILVNPGDFPASDGSQPEPRDWYDQIANGLQLELSSWSGTVPGYHLETALEEIARGDRVPRIRQLEKSLKARGFGQAQVTP